MKITLHLGAHKTGSTYVQDALGLSHAHLAANHRGFVPLQAFRAGFTSRSRKPGPGLDEARSYLSSVIDDMQRAQPKVRRLILSDENLLGIPAEIVDAGVLYPSLEERLELIADCLQPHEVKVLLCLRHPAEFLRSIFTENLRLSPPEFTPVERVRAAWSPEGASWVPVVERIRKLFPQSPLYLWDFAQFRKDPKGMLERISDCRFDTDPKPAVWSRRQGLSQSATEVLLDIGAREGGVAVRRAAHDVARAHPLTDGNWTYAMWSRDEVAAYQKQFSADLATLNRTDGIRFLRPRPPQSGA